jgi:hypothetical protein
VFHKTLSFSDKRVYRFLSLRELLDSSNKNDNQTDPVVCKYGVDRL